MKLAGLFLALMLLLLSTPAFSADKTLVAAADPYPPFVDPDNAKQGLSLEIARAAFATQGYDVKLEIMPWARAETGVVDGVYDILPNVWMTDARKKVLFYSEPYATNVVKFMKRVDDAFEFQGLDSLKGKTIGTVRGYGYGSEFLNADSFTREEANALDVNVNKLIAGRIDLTLEDEIVAKAQITHQDPTLLEKVAFTENALSRNDLHIASGLKNPRHQEIIDAFNKGLAEIKNNGVYQQIMSSYGVQ